MELVIEFFFPNPTPLPLDVGVGRLPGGDLEFLRVVGEEGIRTTGEIERRIVGDRVRERRLGPAFERRSLGSGELGDALSLPIPPSLAALQA
mmetsp:Transcript_24430/g.56646  ORF Transcript_24430/g.56646 Transcript_24430/m.56646 type:complete len:92 (-) Transcript_24430:97-372(-)